MAVCACLVALIIYSEFVTVSLPIDASHWISWASLALSWTGSRVLGFSLSFMPILSHCPPETDQEAQEKVKEVFSPFSPNKSRVSCISVRVDHVKYLSDDGCVALETAEY